MTDDLQWLAAQQPDTDPPAPLVTDRVRSTLVARPRRRARFLVPAASLGAAATVAVLVATGGTPDDVVPQAVAPPPQPVLVELAGQVSDAPEPTGDATLVRHTNDVRGGRSFDGHDLYTDDGRYFYGANRAELRAAIAGVNPTPSTSRRPAPPPADDYDLPAKVRRVAAEAAGLAPEAARARLLEVVPRPKGGPPAAAARREKGIDPGSVPRISKAEQDDNWVWMHASEALVAGAGDPQIRAGVMTILAALPSVHVTPTTFAGREALEVRDTNFSDDYEETYTLDADTGVVLHFRGGTRGQGASVEMFYDVKRVTVAELE